jgi:hypothetical protein
MDQRFGYSIFRAELIGALFGLISDAGSNPLGAMTGAFPGWFAAVVTLEQTKKGK